MEISLQGYNAKYVTLQAEGELQAGDLVVMAGAHTVKKGDTGRMVGIVQAVRGDFALVQTGGHAVVPYTDSGAPTVGFETAAISGAGLAKSAEGGSVLVLGVNESDKTMEILF